MNGVLSLCFLKVLKKGWAVFTLEHFPRVEESKEQGKNHLQGGMAEAWQGE